MAKKENDNEPVPVEEALQTIDEPAIVVQTQESKPVKQNPQKRAFITVDDFIASDVRVRKAGIGMDQAFRTYCNKNKIYRFDSSKEWVEEYEKFINRKFNDDNDK